MKHLTLPLAAVLTLLCGPALLAQEQSAARELTLRGYLHDPVKPAPEPFVFKEPEKSGGKATPITWRADNLSDSIKVRAVENTLFLHLPDGRMAARTTVAGNIRRGIVIVVPSSAAGADLPFRMLLIDDDPARFPYGTSKVLNMTDAEAAVLVDQGKADAEAEPHRILLPSGQVSTIPEVSKDGKGKSAQTNFYIKVKKDNTWVPITERVLEYSDQLRRVYFIFTTPGSRRPPFVRTLLDRKPFTGQDDAG